MELDLKLVDPTVLLIGAASAVLALLLSLVARPKVCAGTALPASLTHQERSQAKRQNDPRSPMALRIFHLDLPPIFSSETGTKFLASSHGGGSKS